MKKILYLIFLGTISLVAKGQVSIGKSNVNGNSSILDFLGNTITNSSSDVETTNIKSIILSAVEFSPTFDAVTPTTDNPNNGTFLFDQNLKMVRMFENGIWVNLSEVAGDTTKLLHNSSNEVGDGIIIGSESSTAKGVLILESTDKAVILPHIKNPHITVKSPYPGMMCYDTVSNSLAVFDGSRWNYWK